MKHRLVPTRGIILWIGLLACGTVARGAPNEAPPASEQASVAEPAVSDVEVPPAQVQPMPKDPLLFEQGPWKIKFGLAAGSQVIVHDSSFWGLADVFAPTANYSNDRIWSEHWIVPSVRFDYAAADDVTLYGGLAAAATGNLGRDVFEQGDTGRVGLEQLYAGVKSAPAPDGLRIDLSGGRQNYRVGTGMLIDLGAQNGNQRGAPLAAPRRAWDYTGILRVAFDRFSADAFVLNYNEITSDDPDTTLIGGKLEYAVSNDLPKDNDVVGLSYFAAIDSTMPYIRAPLTIIENGRDGTQTVDAYTRLRPLRDALPGLYLAIEGAYQWNDNNDLSAYALSAETGYQWVDVAMRPRLSYAFRHFGGDDPDTDSLERFDPMFYDGGVNTFASGANAALAFYNTNVQTHRVSLNLTVTERDFLTLSYWHVLAAEVNSPLQFGQAGRIEEIDGQPVLVSGVPTRHLSDDCYIEYVRVINPNVYLTISAAVSFPGDGLEEQAGESLDPWLGALVNLTVQF